MPVKTFRCDKEKCWQHHREVPLDDVFHCKRHDCLGNQILENRLPEATPPPLWPGRRRLAILAALLVLWIGITTVSRKPSSDLPPLPATPAPATPPPLPTPDPRQTRNPRFEVSSLIACSENLLRLWRAKLVAQDTADAKWINGQRVTAVGRTGPEALERTKSTYQQERVFNELAREKEKEILRETSRYVEILGELITLPELSIKKTLSALRQDRMELSARSEMASDLAERHLLQSYSKNRITIEQVSFDFKENALR